MNILVTGGASGLGEAITRKLASDSSNTVYFTFCNSLENSKKIEQLYSNTTGIKCDFTSIKSVELFIKQIETINFQVLVNNAMTGFETNYFHKLSLDYFTNNFKTNILPTILITQNFISNFRKNKSGKIITILSSYLEGNPPIGLSEYVAAKSYLSSLCKSWSVENMKYNITSNCISPSFMRTPLNKDVDERVIEEMENNLPSKKLLSVEEVAEKVNYLVNAGQEINGNFFLMNPS